MHATMHTYTNNIDCQNICVEPVYLINVTSSDTLVYWYLQLHLVPQDCVRSLMGKVV